MMECFSPETIDHLKYYVYTYADPTNHEIFYIGKGTGNRIFAHEKDAAQDRYESNKIERINQLTQHGQQPELHIIRYGLSETEAFVLEAGLIRTFLYCHPHSYFNSDIDLTNKVAGHDHDQTGTPGELELCFAAPAITCAAISLPHAVAIMIDQPHLMLSATSFKKHQALVKQHVCGDWCMSLYKAQQVQTVIALIKNTNGLIAGIYQVQGMPKVIEAPTPKQPQHQRIRFRLKGMPSDLIGKRLNLNRKVGARLPFKYLW